MSNVRRVADNFYKIYIKSPEKFQQDYLSILEHSRELNETLHAKKVKESQRSLLISGILIALQNQVFITSYKQHKTAQRLADSIVDTIVKELTDANIDKIKVENLRQAYSFITTHTTLSSDMEFLVSLVTDIKQNINDFHKTHRYNDILGQFYIEFLSYANNDKGLGIVLTPPHITELFNEIAEVDKNSVVIDNCCGTAGFMISAMKRMIQDAKGDEQKIKNIKNEQIIGIEFQDDIYALAISNMIIHGDGKTNVFHGDCFELYKKIPRKGTVGFLNPPYKSKKTDIEELEFVLNNLNMLEKNGKCVAIIPMGCVLAQKGKTYEIKKRILEKHRLDAVMSMSGDLFHNSKVMVVTCIVVFTAHVPHSDKKTTWFGYWKDDKFEKVKNKGRIDLKKQWLSVRDSWLHNFRENLSVPGKSVTQIVTANDEWCPEAYMITDFSQLQQDYFKTNVLSFLSFCVKYGDFETIKQFLEFDKTQQKDLKTEDWQQFTYQELFDIKKGKRLIKSDMEMGETPFVGAIDKNNGYRQFIKSEPLHSGNTITVNYNGSIGETYYQPASFWASDDVNVLYPKFPLNVYSALFICTVIRQEKYRFSYGRKWNVERMNNSIIKLPVDGNGKIDTVFMEDYIKSIPYSKKA